MFGHPEQLFGGQRPAGPQGHHVVAGRHPLVDFQGQPEGVGKHFGDEVRQSDLLKAQGLHGRAHRYGRRGCRHRSGGAGRDGRRGSRRNHFVAARRADDGCAGRRLDPDRLRLKGRYRLQRRAG